MKTKQEYPSATLVDRMSVEQRPTGQEVECNSVQPERIPNELFGYSQWVCWRYVDRGEGKKPDKQPVNPHTLHNAGVHWKNTWSQFDIAYASYIHHRMQGIAGLGFVLTPEDSYAAVDIDHCVKEKKINEYACQVIEALGSYTEISPSGTGIRILVACPDFYGNRRTQALEVYSHSRYVTITGNQVAGTSSIIAPRSPAVMESLIPSKEAMQPPPSRPVDRLSTWNVSELDLWEHIFRHDKYGMQHLRRFQGDTSLDRGDHSFTVIRLLNCLARWTQCDPGRMRALMLISPLANDKWFSRRGGGDWLDYQIANAINHVSGRVRK